LGAFASLVDHQLAGGIDVVCACGAIAQGELLTDEERLDCIRVTSRLAAGHVPVVAALTVGPTAIEHARAAAELGVETLLVVPGGENLESLVHFLDELAAGIPGMSSVLYHRPPIRLDESDLRRLQEVGNLVGIKDGHRDVRLFRRLHESGSQPLMWLSAWEDVALPFWSLGCDAFAPASAAYAPAYSRAWFERLEASDFTGAAALLQAHAYPMTDLRLSRPHIEVSVVKAALEAVGLPGGDSRPPAEPLTTAEKAEAQRLVDGLAHLLNDPVQARRRVRPRRGTAT
jgi:4-hydroxy-tetrahydrodipicolinate synthase